VIAVYCTIAVPQVDKTALANEEDSRGQLSSFLWDAGKVVVAGWAVIQGLSVDLLAKAACLR
jgi:hypothetical protein